MLFFNEFFKCLIVNFGMFWFVYKSFKLCLICLIRSLLLDFWKVFSVESKYFFVFLNLFSWMCVIFKVFKYVVVFNLYFGLIENILFVFVVNWIVRIGFNMW